MDPVFFATPADFRNWLVVHHQTERELAVGFHKVGTGRACMSWSESVDEALCFGWIDGVRHSIDGQSYRIRFTPRKPTSIWSVVNMKKIAELTRQGRMYPAGLEAFNKRTANKSAVYAYENAEVTFPAGFEAEFRADSEAWAYFQSLAPSYRKPAVNWVMQAKQETTRRKRLLELIADSAAGKNKWKDY
jgi:uncharacterized protein YdeI (YjbR/CyaY-like superfamily)